MKIYLWQELIELEFELNIEAEVSSKNIILVMSAEPVISAVPEQGASSKGKMANGSPDRVWGVRVSTSGSQHAELFPGLY